MITQISLAMWLRFVKSKRCDISGKKIVLPIYLIGQVMTDNYFLPEIRFPKQPNNLFYSKTLPRAMLQMTGPGHLVSGGTKP